MEYPINFEKLMSFLPKNYTELCFETKAIERIREIKTAEELMYFCLNYLYAGCTLVELSAIALLKDLKISNAAFMKKLAKCNDWYQAIIAEMKSPQIFNYTKPTGLENYNFFAADGSDVVSKGTSKQEFHLHYAINIFSLSTGQFKITDQKTGESLTNFAVKPREVYIADRAYGTKTSIEHCLSGGGEIIARLKKDAFLLFDEGGNKIVLANLLANVTETEVLDLHCFFEGSDKNLVPIRICAVKKTPEEIKKTQEKLRKQEIKKQKPLSEEAKFMNNFIILATSLTQIPAADIFQIYRYRWQVELYFKRLKSILCLGEVPNKKEENIMAWLNGKMLTALLIEQLYAETSFSP
jgi:hypothetical protein